MGFGSNFFDERAQQARFIEGKRGVAGEVDDLRRDVAKNLQPLAPLTVAEYVNAIAVSVTALRIAAPSAAAAAAILPAALTAATLTNMAANPRQVTFTTAGATPAHQHVSATVSGTDAQGKSISETITLAQTAAAVTTNNCFAAITSIELTAGTGTGATLAIGVGAKLGLKYAPKARTGGLVVVAAEFEDTAAVSAAGAIAVAGVNDLPYGTYTPDTVLDATTDFTVMYEFDAALV